MYSLHILQISIIQQLGYVILVVLTKHDISNIWDFWENIIGLNCKEQLLLAL